jgi:2-succinyl-5-enolpyruvyl-6-hydroxy-3-cyclohexene-1-carboxylate synthase
MFHQFGAPETREGQNAEWRSVVGRLCATATGNSGADAGPVHLNTSLREPLVPDLIPGRWPESLSGRDNAAPWVSVQPALRHCDTLVPIPRTLVLLGDLPEPSLSSEVTALARASGWPVIAEPFGAHEGGAHKGAHDSCAQNDGAHHDGAEDGALRDRSSVVPHGPLLLTAGQWLDRHLPARVLVVGRITLARALGELMRNPAVTVEVVAAQSNWPDPSHVAAVVYPFEAVSASISLGRQVDEQWAREWEVAGGLVADAAQAIIAASWPSGLAIATTVLAEVPANATLFVGSSNSARDVDLALSPSARKAPLTVVANRGLAGIDGCVSTAIGLALARPQQPSYALMGDLTFLHDSNGLLIGPHEPRPDLTIVVTNDDGGGIFTLLEPGEPSRAMGFERVFGTPTGASIADLCRAHGVRHTLATTADELGDVVRPHPEGLHVVEVRVDRSGHRDLHADLRAAAANALS